MNDAEHPRTGSFFVRFNGKVDDAKGLDLDERILEGPASHTCSAARVVSGRSSGVFRREVVDTTQTSEPPCFDRELL